MWIESITKSNPTNVTIVTNRLLQIQISNSIYQPMDKGKNLPVKSVTECKYIL